MPVKNSLFPDTIVYESAHFQIKQDCEVPIPGFLIVASKQPKRSLLEFSEQEMNEYGITLKKARKGLRDVLNVHTAYFFQNEDTEHGFHTWLVPRQSWMEPFGKKIQSVRPIMEHAKKMRANPQQISEVNQTIEALRNYFH